MSVISKNMYRHYNSLQCALFSDQPSYLNLRLIVVIFILHEKHITNINHIIEIHLRRYAAYVLLQY